jgi:hypothetical protein
MRAFPMVLLCGLGLGVSAHATEPPASTTVMFSGVKVGVDPKTGRMRPLTPAESRQLDQALTRGKKPSYPPGLARSFNPPATEVESRLTVRALAHGGIAVKLPAEQYSTVSATRTVTGEVEIIHDGDVATDSAGVPNE